MLPRLKTWLTLAALLFLGLAVWAGLRARAADARAAALEEDVDSIAAVVDSLEVEAARASERATQAVQELQRERVRSREVIARERRRAEAGESRFVAAGEDLVATLESIAAAAPEVSHLVEGAQLQVRDLEAAHESVVDAQRAQMVQMQELLELSDTTIARLQEQVAAEQQVNAGLREQLVAQEELTAHWKREARPGLLRRIGENADLVGIAAVGGAAIYAVVR